MPSWFFLFSPTWPFLFCQVHLDKRLRPHSTSILPLCQVHLLSHQIAISKLHNHHLHLVNAITRPTCEVGFILCRLPMHVLQTGQKLKKFTSYPTPKIYSKLLLHNRKPPNQFFFRLPNENGWKINMNSKWNKNMFMWT